MVPKHPHPPGHPAGLCTSASNLPGLSQSSGTPGSGAPKADAPGGSHILSCPRGAISGVTLSTLGGQHTPAQTSCTHLPSPGSRVRRWGSPHQASFALLLQWSSSRRRFYGRYIVTPACPRALCPTLPCERWQGWARNPRLETTFLQRFVGIASMSAYLHCGSSHLKPGRGLF